MASRPPRAVATAVLEHRSPGRVRIRVQKEHRSAANLDRIQRHLSGHPQIRDVQVNARSGSVLIHSDNAEAVRNALAEVLEIVRPAVAESETEPTAEVIVALVKRADKRLRTATGGKFSLRWLIPATFVSVGVRQLLAEGLTLGTVPWYVLIYYGVDSFLKLYPDHAPQPTIAAVEHVNGAG